MAEEIETNETEEAVVEEDDGSIDIEWKGSIINTTRDEYENMLGGISGLGVNTFSTSGSTFSGIADSLGGIFGMPYQFSKIVDLLKAE